MAFAPLPARRGTQTRLLGVEVLAVESNTSAR
jgi:hypothetical protein